MTTRTLIPLAAFDIEGGIVDSVDEKWPKQGATRGYRWLHLDLSDGATRLWAREHLPEIAARALLQTETRPRCERHENGLILNLRGVNLNPQSDPEDMVSLRMWVTQTGVTSARMRKVWAIDAIRENAQGGKAPASVGVFLAELSYGLTNRIEKVTLGLEEETDALEELVATGQTAEPGKISALRQAVIKMRRFINPQREAIVTLAALEGWIIAPEELALLRETSNRTRRIVEELDATRDRLSALQDYLNADRANALSRNSYVLSVIAAIFLPLGFLTGLFGVNVAGMPGTASESAFWWLIGASVVSGVALYMVFKLSKWL